MASQADSNTVESAECPVCQVVLDQPNDDGFKEEAVTTPCNHTFGKRCLRLWLMNGSRTCPMCRNNLNVWKADLVTADEKLVVRFDTSFNAALVLVGGGTAVGDRVPRNRELRIRAEYVYLRDHVDESSDPRLQYFCDALGYAVARMDRKVEPRKVLTYLLNEILAEVLPHVHGDRRGEQNGATEQAEPEAGRTRPGRRFR